MIVKIDKSVVEALEMADGENLDAISFIDDLCRLRKQGHILIDIQKKISLRVKASDKISPLNRVIFGKISEDMTFNRKVLNYLDQKITFYSSDYLNPQATPDFNNSRDIVGYANSDSPLKQPKLILEDLEDSKVYSAIANWNILNQKELTGFRVSYAAVHGGGSRTANVCAHEYSSGSLIYSICDSDKKSPTCSLGTTATDVESFFTVNNILDNFHVIGAHEVENLIPAKVMVQCARPTQLPAIEFITFAANIESSCYLYYDFKNGFKYNQIYNDVSSVSEYWEPIYDSYGGVDQIKSDITTGAMAKNSVMFNKLSSMLPYAVNHMEISDIDDLTPNSLENQWREIGQKLISWFIASQPIRV